MYPVLAFMEHFFTDAEASEALANEVKLRRYSGREIHSEEYRAGCDRCFAGLCMEEAEFHVPARVPRGGEESEE